MTSTYPRRIGRRRILAVGLGLSAISVGLASWRHFAVERDFLSGLAAIERGDVDEITRVSASLPVNSPRAMLLLASLDLQYNSPASALRKLKTISHDPNLALRAQFLAGEALCRLQDYDMAMKTLQGALDQDPNDINGHRWMAVAAYDTGAMAKSIDHLNAIVRLNRNDAGAHRMLGAIYYEAEEFPLAISEYQESLRCSRKQEGFETVLAELANALLRVHRYEDVLTNLDGSAPNPELDALRGEALYALGHTSEAAQFVERALAVANEPRALALKGLMLMDEGKPGLGAASLEQAVSLRPEDFETRAKLTQAYAQSGDVEKARSELEAFERIKLIRQEIHELSMQAATQPEAAEARYQLGRRYYSLGLQRVAEKWLRATLALDNTHRAARELLNEITASSNRS